MLQLPTLDSYSEISPNNRASLGSKAMEVLVHLPTGQNG
jgi:hypothetical protein